MQVLVMIYSTMNIVYSLFSFVILYYIKYGFNENIMSCIFSKINICKALIMCLLPLVILQNIYVNISMYA